MNGVENQGPDFGDFPIQMAENSQKRPYFDGSYLGNRQVSPFWKEDMQGYNSDSNKIKKVLGDPLPPVPLRAPEIFYTLGAPKP